MEKAVKVSEKHIWVGVEDQEFEGQTFSSQQSERKGGKWISDPNPESTPNGYPLSPSMAILPSIEFRRPGQTLRLIVPLT